MQGYPQKAGRYLLAMQKLRIGTRGSPLAMVQADWVRKTLLEHYKTWQVEVVALKTCGDLQKTLPLSELGGKGAFTREIEKALLAGEIDLAVHSMKDLPMHLPSGLLLAAITERENPFDVFISRTRADLDSLPLHATIATGSLRRKAQLLHYRGDLIIKDIRGNVDTRLKKLHRGFAEGLVLAAAALRRLNREASITQYLPPDVCLPAAGQGALGIEIREEDRSLGEKLVVLNDRQSSLAVRAERSFLHVLGVGCHTPAGAYGEMRGGEILLRGFVSSPDGKGLVKMKMLGREDDAEILGDLLARRILNGGGRELLAGTHGEP